MPHYRSIGETTVTITITITTFVKSNRFRSNLQEYVLFISLQSAHLLLSNNSPPPSAIHHPH